MDRDASKRSRGAWKWGAISVLLAVMVLAIAGEVMLRRAAPILKGRVIETLSTRFRSVVVLDDLQVSVLRGLQVSANGLRIYPPKVVVDAGATQPLIVIAHFSFRAELMGLLVKPTHARTVRNGTRDQHPSAPDAEACGSRRIRS